MSVPNEGCFEKFIHPMALLLAVLAAVVVACRVQRKSR